MGVIDFIKDIIRPGNGVDYPKPGDMVTVHYHGYLYDPTRSWNRGRRYARCVALHSFITLRFTVQSIRTHIY